jgi:hypothetical protein
MGLELVDQPRFVLDRRFASVEAACQIGWSFGA